MRNILIILFIAASLGATAQLQTPAASSAGSVTSRIGLTDIKIEYSRPKMKGRKVFGAGTDYLVPFGKIWRTGANNGTTIEFTDAVKVEGKDVPQGKYLIFTWPGADQWTVALYKDLEIGGDTPSYDTAKELTRFKVKAEKLTEKVETFTLAIGDISDDNTSAKVQIAWENTSAKFGVTVDYESKIKNALDQSSIVAAHYYFESKKDAKQALKWVNEYFADGKHSNEFWNLNFKAEVQKALGDKAGATATAQKSIEVAKANKGGDFGYIKRNEDLIKSMK